MADRDAEERTAAEFETLLIPLLETAYGTAYRMTRNREEAEDVVQEAALQAFRAYHTFQAGTNFKAWFFAILVNCFRGRYRKRKREPEIAPLEDVSELYMYIQTSNAGLYQRNANPAALVIDRMSEEQIEMAIEALPEDYRMVCVLYFMEQISYQEIADIIQCPVGTVRSRLHRGRKLLQKALWELAESAQIISDLKAESGRRG